MPKLPYHRLVDVRLLFGRLLTYRGLEPTPENPHAIPKFITLPYGSVVNIADFQLQARRKDGHLDLIAVHRTHPRYSIQLYPAYSAKATVWIDTIGKVELSVRQLTKVSERVRAMQLIMRSHYLSAPLHGMLLGCWFAKKDEQKAVRLKAKSDLVHEDWSDSWNEPLGSMVGCAVLDTLYHGNPLGREFIAQQIGVKWDRTKRKEMLTELNVAWASRFAVDAPYRGIGIGTELARHMLELAYKHRVPRADFVEVITTETKNRATSRFEQDTQSFLTAAGYHLVPNSYRSRRLLVPDDDGVSVAPANSKRLYYFGSTHLVGIRLNKQKPLYRLFVPLAKDPYDWFLSGAKQWELRKHRGQYTEKNVIIDRDVELRLGYRDSKTSMYGTITRIVCADSLEAFFRQVPYGVVIPIASSRQDAIDISARILSVTPDAKVSLIGFKIAR